MKRPSMIFPCAPRISLPDPFSPLLHFSISFTFQKRLLLNIIILQCHPLDRAVNVNVSESIYVLLHRDFPHKKLFCSVVSFYLLKSFQALEVLSFDRDLTFCLVLKFIFLASFLISCLAVEEKVFEAKPTT